MLFSRFVVPEVTFFRAKIVIGFLSPARPSGPSIDLSVNGVLAWFHGQQLDVTRFNSRPFHYPKEGPGSVQKDGLVKLCAREETVAFISNIMESRRCCFEGSVFDQKASSIPVCSGLSGLGKTRLLDEWATFADGAHVVGSRLGIFCHVCEWTRAVWGR